ncbi:hypothetical protein M9458_051324, partial [Cirrhinus mrigala]
MKTMIHWDLMMMTVIVMNLVIDLRSAHHQMPLWPCHHTLTVALHPGLHLPLSIALIASAPVTNHAPYLSPGLCL